MGKGAFVDFLSMKAKQKPSRSKRKPPVTFATVRKICLALPNVEEGTSYGTPAFKVGGVLFARKHQDGESLVIKISFEERAIRMKVNSETFYITDHYLNCPMMLVRISSVDPADLQELLEESWRRSVPARLQSALESPDD